MTTDELAVASSQPFRVYLDSKDIIEVDRDRKITESLPEVFVNARATLVLSSTLIDELLEPLRRREGGSVTRLMNTLEATPHCWLRTVDLEQSELRSASEAVSAKCTLMRPVPFRSSYLETGFVDDKTRHHYLGKPLAAIVWDQVYGERNTVPTPNLADRFPEVVKADRQIIATLSENDYRRKLRQKFDQAMRSIVGDARSNQALLDFFWMHPDACPATRLNFEAYHTLVRDTQTSASVNDVNDLTRFMAVPYVDVFTADGAKWDLLRKLRTRPGLTEMEHWNRVKVFRSLHEVFVLLEEKTRRLADNLPTQGE